jgi:nitroreductase
VAAAIDLDHTSHGDGFDQVTCGADFADWAQALIHSRQNVAPRRLVDPAPNDVERFRLFEAAAAAPDHGQILPWRFVIVPAVRRADLGQAFAAALLERDPGATPEQVADARDKAARAPLLMLVVARLGPAEPDIPVLERMVAVGAAIQNLQLQAHAMGYGCGLTSGRALTATPLRRLFGLADSEQAVCFINVGTVSRRKPLRPRPSPHDFVTELI